jgi:hypothetical protein
MPVIVTMSEVQIGRLRSNKERTGVVAQVEEYLSSKCEALSSSLHTARERREGEKEEMKEGGRRKRERIMPHDG